MKPYWEMEHGKLYHGDCLEIMRKMHSESVDMVITSPPYPGNNAMWGELYCEDNFLEAHNFLGEVWRECLRLIRPGGKLAINIANTKRRPYLTNTVKTYNEIGENAEPLGEIIWHKGFSTKGTAWGSYCNPSDPALSDQHEYILLFRKWGDRAKRPGYFLNPKQFKSWRNSIWKIQTVHASSVGHRAPFPIEIPQRLILLYSYEGETILDPFLGSGTTAMAAQKLNRKWVGIEIEEDVCRLAENRIRNDNSRLDLFKSRLRWRGQNDRPFRPDLPGIQFETTTQC